MNTHPLWMIYHLEEFQVYDMVRFFIIGSQQQQQQQQQQIPPMQQPGMAWNPQAQQYNPYPYMQQWPQSGYTGGYPGYGY